MSDWMMNCELHDEDYKELRELMMELAKEEAEAAEAKEARG